MKTLGYITVLAFGAMSQSSVASERTMFVTGDNLNVRVCASGDCCIARRLNRNEQVPVFEQKDGWARISVFYDPEAEPQCRTTDGLIAQWVAARFLSFTPPAGYDPNEWFGSLGDKRIRGVPKVGDYGLTRRDIELIRRYAAHLLQNDECKSIETGNKSMSKDDTYYVYCAGDDGQRFFTSADLTGR